MGKRDDVFFIKIADMKAEIIQDVRSQNEMIQSDQRKKLEALEAYIHHIHDF